MGPDARRSAEEIVNSWSELALRNLLQNNGELHDSRAMAEDIVRVCIPSMSPAPHVMLLVCTKHTLTAFWGPST